MMCHGHSGSSCFENGRAVIEWEPCTVAMGHHNPKWQHAGNFENDR